MKQFCKKDLISKLAFEVECVLLSTGRILDTMNHKETRELKGIVMGDLGVKSHLPVIERYSPLA